MALSYDKQERDFADFLAFFGEEIRSATNEAFVFALRQHYRCRDKERIKTGICFQPQIFVFLELLFQLCKLINNVFSLQ